jgi:hypothetical protein
MNHKLTDIEEYKTRYRTTRIKARCWVCDRHFDYAPNRAKRVENESCPHENPRADKIFFYGPAGYKETLRRVARKKGFRTLTAFIVASLSKELDSERSENDGDNDGES